MSQHKKLERILDLLVNEEADKAEELLHNLVVEKARNIYESLVNEEDVEDEDLDEEEVDESIGGSAREDFMGEIEAEKNDIEADELQDGEVGDEGYDEVDFEGGDELEGDFEGEELEVEDRVEDLEAQLSELRAEFEQLMSDELEEPNHDAEDFAGEYGDEAELDGAEVAFGGEEEAYIESIEEATKLQDNVPDPGMSKEGKLAGTGKNSKTGATGTEAPYTKAPTKSLNGADPVDFTKGSEGGEHKGPFGGDAETAKDDTPSSNIDVKQSDVGAGEQSAEGKFVGTGKNSKSGQTQTKSPLSKAPKHP